MNIVAMRADNYGCGNYRVNLPLTYLQQMGHKCTVYQVEERAYWTPDWFADSDICIVQRGIDPQVRAMLDCIPPGRRPALVYEVDDLLWDMGTERVSYRDFKGDVQRRLCETMRVSDAVIVSTPELAERVRPHNPQVFILGNSIDFALRDWETRPEWQRREGEVVIGWAGSVRPTRDMVTAAQGMRDALYFCPQATLALAGDVEQSHEFVAAMRVPEERVRYIQPVPFSTYHKLLTQFDIGIAPVEDTVFNSCKSELKLLEYGAWGIPFVASAVAPYRRFAETVPGAGFLANSAKQWRKALETLVSQPGLRRDMGDRAKAGVLAHYDMGKRALVYESVFESISGAKRCLTH